MGPRRPAVIGQGFKPRVGDTRLVTGLIEAAQGVARPDQVVAAGQKRVCAPRDKGDVTVYVTGDDARANSSPRRRPSRRVPGCR
jgi:hypothetical protein